MTMATPSEGSQSNLFLRVTTAPAAPYNLTP